MSSGDKTVLTGIDSGKFLANRWYPARLIDFFHHKHHTLGLETLLWMNSRNSRLGPDHDIVTVIFTKLGI